MTMIAKTADVTEINRALVGVARANEWQGRRVYINVQGNRTYRGERTAKLYIELDTLELVHVEGPGMTSSAYREHMTTTLAYLTGEVA